MVLVNNPGDWGNLYPQLAHAKWHGWTFTDTIFPFFLFIGGVSMALSLGRLADAGADKPTLLRKLARRAALIFLIGLGLNLIPQGELGTLRIPGVLQRIALCTLLAAPIVVYCTWRAQLAWIVALLAAYSAVMLWLPVPGFGAGVLEPGKDAGAWIDRLLLDGHLWAQSRTWDPEGVLSTLPALCSQLLGVLAGRWLLARREAAEKTVWMMLAGLLLLFSAFYWLLDAKAQPIAVRWSTPFTIYGMNALFIFAFSSLVAKLLGVITVAQPDGTRLALGNWLYAPLRALDIAPVNSSLLYALVFNAAMFAVAWFMWRNQWFVKV
jgi:predicted acyltransferase